MATLRILLAIPRNTELDEPRWRLVAHALCLLATEALAFAGVIHLHGVLLEVLR